MQQINTIDSEANHILAQLGCKFLKTVWYDNIIFLDIDGVLNSRLFYEERHKSRKLKGYMSNDFKLDYYKSNLCKDRIELLNDLCEETNSAVVISSTWRQGRTVEELQTMLSYAGAKFTVIGITPSLRVERGSEIRDWLKRNIKPETHGMHYYDFISYAIIDDDSDMLMWQMHNYFHCDGYAGLTHNVTYKIKRLFNSKKLQDV